MEHICPINISYIQYLCEKMSKYMCFFCLKYIWESWNIRSSGYQVCPALVSPLQRRPVCVKERDVGYQPTHRPPTLCYDFVHANTEMTKCKYRGIFINTKMTTGHPVNLNYKQTTNGKNTKILCRFQKINVFQLEPRNTCLWFLFAE